MIDPTRAQPNAASPWPRRLAASALLAAVPLVFFGGSVTTLHAGLAIDGWLVLEPGRGDHFLWLYPVDKWFRDVGTFVEHSHRLFGSLVGLLAIATVVATWALDRRRLQRGLSLAALLAVIGQGAIGGYRVLERSESLAFLHGAIAQGVFALLGACWIALSPGFRPALPRDRSADGERARTLRRLSLAAVAAVYLQILAGAWLRHGGGMGALGLHLAVALPVLILVPLLARRLRDGLDGASAEDRRRFRRLGRFLIGAIAVQVALGLAALVVVSTPDRASGGLGTAVMPTLHVVGGGVLLLACVASSMWVHRTAEGEAPRHARERWEGAR